MTEVLHANVFFFITSIAVIVFSILLCLALFHIIKILKAVRRIIDRIDEGSEILAEDISQFRRYFSEGSLLSHVIGIFFGKGNEKDGDTSKKKSARREKQGEGKTELNITDED